MNLTGMKLWCKRHLGVLAVLFATTTGLLAVVVGYQAVMLHARGWRWDLGTVPAWLSGVGSFATFGALWVATRQWKSRQEERHDDEINQARLIMVEESPPDGLSAWQSEKPAPNNRDVRIRNFSSEPIFNLRVEDHAPNNADALVWIRDRTLAIFEELQVLQADKSTGPLIITGNDKEDPTPTTELIEFTFTDVRGARWRRVGSSQPVRLLGNHADSV